MLDELEERRSAAAARDRKVKADDERFLTDFAGLRRDVVRPVFEAAGAVLVQRGHGFDIAEQEFGVDSSGKPTEAGIALHIVPAGTGPLPDKDHAHTLSITTRHYNKTLWIDAGIAANVGGLGSKRACTLEQVNAQLVEDELLKFVAAIVAA